MLRFCGGITIGSIGHGRSGVNLQRFQFETRKSQHLVWAGFWVGAMVFILAF
jgi:putative copper export protein